MLIDLTIATSIAMILVAMVVTPVVLKARNTSYSSTSSATSIGKGVSARRPRWK